MTAWRWAVLIGTGLACAAAGHTRRNMRLLISPQAPVEPVTQPVAVLIPARDEASRIGRTLTSVLAQRGVPRLTVTVLDDASSDGTTAAALAVGAGDPRLTVLPSAEDPPPGWLGKPYACQRLADQATAGILVFLDADVVLTPDAIASAVRELRAAHADFASPWPRQLASGWLGRLIQPLQQWSWGTTLPLGLSARSLRPSMAAANGQFLVLTSEGYRAAGGHAAVRGCVLEDIELARAFRRARRGTVVWDGSRIAACRMYLDAAELHAGYRKSLWTAFGPRGTGLLGHGAAGLAAGAGLALTYLVPPLAVLVGPGTRLRCIGAAGYAAGVAGRAIVARRTGSPVWPDSLAHPLSVAALLALLADSLLARARGQTRWKDRGIDAAACAAAPAC